VVLSVREQQARSSRRRLQCGSPEELLAPINDKYPRPYIGHVLTSGALPFCRAGWASGYVN
jgi:hypothetical protein